MDMNSVTLSGRVFGMRLARPKGADKYGMAEGRIVVTSSRRKDADVSEEFVIRSYGKKAKFLSGLKDGTFAVVMGRLVEDERFKHSPDRHASYVNVVNVKTVGMCSDGYDRDEHDEIEFLTGGVEE